MSRTALWGTALLLLSTSACSNGGAAPALRSSEIPDPATTSTNESPIVASPNTTLQKLTFQMGPYALAAHSGAEAMRERPGKMRFQVDEPVWVVGFESQLQDSNGNPLPNTLLHLAWLSNKTDLSLLCATKQTGNPFAAVTAALKKIALPDGYGYAVYPEDTLEAAVVLHNPHKEHYGQVYFSFTLITVPMNTGVALKHVAPLLLEPDPCTHLPPAVEPGGYVRHTQRVTVPTAGHVIAAYGLLQKYGVAAALQKEGEPSPFWQATATINASHQILQLPSYQDPVGIAFKAGEGIEVSSTYQNFSSQWIDATTAAMVYMASADEDGAAALMAKPYQPKQAVLVAGQVQALLLE